MGSAQEGAGDEPVHGVPVGDRPVRVLATRHPARSGPLVRHLGDRGLAPLLSPLREPRLPEAQDGCWWRDALEAGPYDAVVLTSANAVLGMQELVGAGGDRASLAGLWPRARVLSVGEATARAAGEAGLEPAPVPGRQSASGLLSAWPEGLGPGARLLVVRGTPHRPELVAGLAERGAEVHEALAYAMTEYPAPSPLLPRSGHGDGVTVLDPGQTARALATGGADVVVATSPEMLRALHRLGPVPEPVVCIGRTTAAAAEDLGLRSLVSDSPAPADLADAAARVAGTGR